MKSRLRQLIAAIALFFLMSVYGQNKYAKIQGKAHPRLFLGEEESGVLKENIKKNHHLTLVNDQLRKIGDSLGNLPSLKHKKNRT
ncbi:hypothetical protein [Elizabethkingia sp. JS20170427COW]|uniref:hypothetical protein n=1 Tax=Elizabethkingia sp. JS20170427COW TaxID=2583851 RepID=UPI0011101F8B|nr:hypothetical protein [Elizabethkingia sp. JS20170427COW]QCX52804.1 hypothetical protein FGE20_03120 [Elizabethkingia sp. JS20170427COW]